MLLKLFHEIKFTSMASLFCSIKVDKGASLKSIGALLLATNFIRASTFSLKEFINTQKVFNATIEEKLNKVDDMSRSIDRISHDVETLKMKKFVPKV